MNREARTIAQDASLQSAAKRMSEWGVSSLVVEPEDAHDAFGIVTRKDVVEAYDTAGAGTMPLLVEDVMTKPAITVNPELSLHQCLQLMRLVGVRRVPVVKDGALVGILSNTDVFRHLAGTLT